jgi:hypothetical protein
MKSLAGRITKFTEEQTSTNGKCKEVVKGKISDLTKIMHFIPYSKSEGLRKIREKLKQHGILSLSKEEREQALEEYNTFKSQRKVINLSSLSKKGRYQ